MKLKTIIDPTREEEVLIYAHQKTSLVEAIESLVQDAARELIGYREREAVPLDLATVYCFTVEDDRVWAKTAAGDYAIKQRLYQLEDWLPAPFIKINQSCIANIRQIQKFDTALAGTLQVVFRGGHTDYVSRRQLKHVKERLGL